MHDAIMIEHTGIAATAIITERFVPTVHAMAVASGRPDLPCAVIPHPISHNDDRELQAKAAAAVQQCVTILTQPSPETQTINLNQPGAKTPLTGR